MHAAERPQSGEPFAPPIAASPQPAAADASARDDEPQAAYDFSERAGVMCERRAIPPNLRLRQSPSCVWPASPLCSAEIECHRHEECVERAHGRCAGSVDGVCNYPTLLWSERYTRCARDADCKEVAGGRCERMVVSTWCEYDECARDGECAADERCACQAYYKVCMKVGCLSDAECPVGERCLASSPCEEIIHSYGCSSSGDECREDSDCNDPQRPTCAFRDGKFRCGEACIVDVFL